MSTENVDPAESTRSAHGGSGTSGTTPISFRLESEVDRELVQVAEFNGIPKASLIKIAIKAYLRAVRAQGVVVAESPVV